MNYICLCNYQTNKKSNMKNHINRKKLCSDKLKDSKIVNDILMLCNYCSKQYIDKLNHEEMCNIKKNYDDVLTITESLNKFREEIKEEIRDIKSKPTYITNHNVVNVSLNNVLMYNLSHISNEQIKKFLEERDVDEFAPYVFEIIFYNPDFPDNHSIFYINDKCIYIHEGSCKFKSINIKDFYKFTDERIYKTSIRLINNIIEETTDKEDIKKYQEIKSDYMINRELRTKKLTDQDRENIRDIMINSNCITEETFIKLASGPQSYLLPPKLIKHINGTILCNKALEGPRS